MMTNNYFNFEILRKLELNPFFTQRELSYEMNASLGKVNYCIKKLVQKGLIKVNNFSNNTNKVGYIYLLTPKGIEQKTALTFSFLKAKMDEYEVLEKEISALKKDLDKLDL
jgi:EPS-associated MarR family transcriptional regulator